jgi:hypothetical protein
MSIFERDQAFAEELAFAPGNSLGQISARLFLKARGIDEERQRRRDRQAADWRSYEEACHQRAAEVASAPTPPPKLTMGQVEPLVRGIAAGVTQVVAEKIRPLEEKLATVERASGTLGLALEVGLAGVEARLDEMYPNLDRSPNGTEPPPRVSEIAELKARINELEARPLLEDAGVWNQSTVYRPGQTVTCGGSAWVCKEANSNGKPGTSDSWRLMIKKGRNGKDKR